MAEQIIEAGIVSESCPRCGGLSIMTTTYNPEYKCSYTAVIKCRVPGKCPQYQVSSESRAEAEEHVKKLFNRKGARQ